MNKLISFVFGISIVCVSAADAMPFHTAHAASIIPVGSGCGIGVNRGPYDGCVAIYHEQPHNYFFSYRSFDRGYANGYYYGPRRSLVVDQGECRGGGIYRVCNIHGMCWARCY
jgi:hypothetical protein